MAKKTVEVAREIYDDTTSIQSEAYQKLQVNLDYASIDEKYKIISCVSSTQGEGKTTTLVNLANVYALKGAKVLVIDLDLRSPTVHRFFKVTNDAGITEYLMNKASIDEENYDESEINNDCSSDCCCERKVIGICNKYRLQFSIEKSDE